MNENHISKPYTIKDRGLGEIIIAQAAMNRLLDKLPFDGMKVYSYQYQGAALDTIAWFMYGVKPVKFTGLLEKS